MEVIDLQKNEQMIPYKEYIRKIVYAHTVNYHNSYDTRFRAVEIFRKLPVREPRKFPWSIIFIWLLGVASGIYIFWDQILKGV
jgi:hypothetical protein